MLLGLSHPGHDFQRERSRHGRTALQVNHRRPRIQRLLEFLRRVHHDHLHADVAYREVVGGPRAPRHDDLGLLETGQIGNPLQLLGIAARHARGGDVLQSRGAAGRHHAPLGTGQLGKPLSDRVRQFVHLHVVSGRRLHRGPTSGRSTDPPMMVNVPRQLMMGSTPIDW